IASLLITFFYTQMRGLITDGHLFLALPPLYKISQGGKTAYARDDAHKDELLQTAFSGRGKVEISRFKGLGEMMPAQLKETAMAPAKRILLKVQISDEISITDDVVEQLMGNKPEGRFRFIQEHAEFAHDLDI
ncbi:MAG TPA: DNA topoisomerase IV subunit B, partial [Hyphomicrobiales bacterium]|nr:DNA topoisomerase IV subunit B [Hyphomicrobiales bacterium]